MLPPNESISRFGCHRNRFKYWQGEQQQFQFFATGLWKILIATLKSKFDHCAIIFAKHLSATSQTLGIWQFQWTWAEPSAGFLYHQKIWIDWGQAVSPYSECITASICSGALSGMNSCSLCKRPLWRRRNESSLFPQTQPNMDAKKPSGVTTDGNLIPRHLLLPLYMSFWNELG